jgi:uncharacterized repeat protein (TIGR01451 family)
MNKFSVVTDWSRRAKLLTLTAAACFVFPFASFADMAANNIIRNTATVSYSDASGTAQDDVSAYVDVTVDLLAATPTLSAPVDQSIDASGTATYAYSLTTNANGPDEYTLSVDSVVGSSGISGATATWSSTTLTLGASTLAEDTTIAASGTTVLTVPSDDTDDSAVNSLVAGDTVVINDLVYTVSAVDDTNNNNPGTSTITVNGNGTAAVVTNGDLISERVSVNLIVSPGTVVSDTDENILVEVIVTDGETTDTEDSTTTTVIVATLSVTKEVSVNGGSFTSSPIAAPGATLTYRITVTNSGSASATSVVITDPLPMFTTYVENSAKFSDVLATAYASAADTLTDIDDTADDYDFSVTTADNVTYTAGTLASSESAVLYFQVTIND